MNRVEVSPQLLRWARGREGLSQEDLVRRFPRLVEWEQGEVHPTLKQLEAFAKATHTPFGYFFLPQPPKEEVPIPDLRTIGSQGLVRPSPNLLDTLYLCQQRQQWYREYARSTGQEPRDFVGSETLTSNIEEVAARIRHTLDFDLEERRRARTWTEALRRFIEQADESGILVMVNGVVGSNNYRKLDPEEFRGFALADALAPLIFINGADTKAAQMFTLAHELAHLWLGQSALSDVGPPSTPTHEVERWCNAVAAEILVPLERVQEEYRGDDDLRAEMDRLARRFKVSTLVILRRIYDGGGLSRKQFELAYRGELSRLLNRKPGSGGNFYLTTGARAGKRFARALVASTLEGRSSFTEALRLLGFKKMSTFRELGHSLGIGF